MTLTTEERRKRHNEGQQKYRDAHPEYHKEWYQLFGKQFEAEARIEIKVEVLTHYGKGRLACRMCGESRLACLSIDHINGRGISHRKSLNRYGYRFYIWLKRQGFPKGYQTLCMNCQFVKAILDRARSCQSDTTKRR